MDDWQQLRVERRATVRRTLPGPVRGALRRPVHLTVAAALLGCGVLATLPTSPATVHRCRDTGGTCARLTTAEEEPALRTTTRCVPSPETGTPSTITIGRLEDAAGDPVDVLRVPRADGEEVFLSVPDRDAVTVGGGTGTPSTTLQAASTWSFPSAAAADAWLDARDDALLRRERLAGRSGPVAALTETLAGAASADVTVDPTLTATTVAASEAAVDLRPNPEARAAARHARGSEPYGVARLDDRALLVTDDRRAGWTTIDRVRPFVVTRGPQAGTGFLRVTGRTDGGDETVTAVEVVHVGRVEGATSAASLSGGGEEARLRVTTVRVDVGPENREDVAGWLALVEHAWDDGVLPVPPNLLDPASRVERDPVQDALYLWADVVRSERIDSAAIGNATFLPWTGPAAGADGLRPEAAGEDLQDRSADGVRRVVRDLDCGHVG